MLDRLIAEAEATAESQRLDGERFVREQRMLDEQVPAIWKRLRTAMKSKCERYPQHLKFDVCVESEATIRGANRRVLEVRFLQESKVITFECNGGTGLFSFRLDRQNIALLCDSDGVPFPSEDHVADQLLSMILRNPGHE
jgi:hypothetical protein